MLILIIFKHKITNYTNAIYDFSSKMTLLILINFFALSQNVHNVFIITEEVAIGS